MAIIRGYNFSPIEELTNLKLQQLVENADITAINWSEFQGGLIAISQFSAPSPASIGWISAVYEKFFLTPSSFSGVWMEHNFIIEGPVGPVALWTNGGLESRRFVTASDNHRPGGVCMINTPSASATLRYDLTSGSAAFGDPRVVGINTWATAITSSTDNASIPRIRIKGLSNARSASPNSADPHPRYLWRDNAITEDWGMTNTTNGDKIWGVEMQSLDISSTRLVWLFGAPVWRL